MKNLAMFLTIMILMTLSISAQIDVWEATSGITKKTFPLGDTRLNVKLTGALGSNNKDFIGAGDEFYDIYYSNQAGTEVVRDNNSCVTIRGQYNGGSPQGFNITKVAYGNNYYPYVTAYTLGSNGNAASVYNAVDGNQNTATALGKASGTTNFMSITVCKEALALDVSCPPIDERIAGEQFVFEFQPGQPQTNYRMNFTATQSFKTSMQSYINNLYSTNNNIKTLGIIWSLFDCGSNQTPNCQPWQTAASISNFGIAWTSPNPVGLNGQFGFYNNLNFTTSSANGQTLNPPYPMKVNNWYRIASWKHLDKFWIKGPCPDSDFLVRIFVGGAAMRSEPTIEIANSKGKIIERRPVKTIKK